MTLKEARFKANMTQSLLSLKAKLDISRISRIENGLLAPTDRQKKAISKALNTKNIEYHLCK